MRITRSIASSVHRRKSLRAISHTSDTKRLEPLCLVTVNVAMATAAADLLKPRNALNRLEDAADRATIAGFNATSVQARVVSQSSGVNTAPKSEIKLPSHLMLAVYLAIPTDEAKNIKALKYKDQLYKQTQAIENR